MLSLADNTSLKISLVILWRPGKLSLYGILLSYSVILFIHDFNNREALVTWKKGQFIDYLVFLITFEALCQLLITVHNHTIANEKIFPFFTSKYYYYHHHHHYCYYHNWEMNGFDLVLSMVYLLQYCYSLHLFYILLLLFFIQILQIEISSFFCSSNNVELLTLPSTNKKIRF